MTLPDKWAIPRRLGLSVFPIVPYRKNPLIKWKIYQSYHAPESVVEDWHRATPNANVGVATGATSGVIVLDLDDDAAVIEAYARGVPHTLSVQTPRGMHMYFRHPGGDRRVSNSAGKISDGIDLRGDGGFVVAPGSHFIPDATESASGKREGWYHWADPAAPIADAPAWVLEGRVREQRTDSAPAAATLYRGQSEAGDRALAEVMAELVTAATPGKRNETFNECAFAAAQLVAGGWVETDATWQVLHAAVVEIGDSYEKDLDTITRAWQAGLGVPRVVLARTDPDEVLGAPPEVQGRAAPPPPPPVSVGPAERPAILTPMQYPDYFEGCVYVNGRDEFFVPSGQFLKRSAFDGTYGGPNFLLGSQGDQPSKSASDAFLKNSVWVAPRAQGTCFRPEYAPGSLIVEEGMALLNCYVPVPIRRMAGDAGPFIRHVEKLLPVARDRAILLNWMASHVQNVGHKHLWWPVVQGTKGNGKTLLASVMTYCSGRRYTHIVNPQAMVKTGNQFNDWIMNKRLIIIEEVKTDDRRELLEMLKPMVTNDHVVTEGKGLRQSTADNRANGLALTNYKEAVPVDNDERRYAIFFTAQQSEADIARDGMGGSYFPKLWDWLRADGFAIVYDYLSTFPLDPMLDPAQLANRAPLTSSMGEAVQLSHGVLEQEILDRVEEGLPGFCGGIISSKALASAARDVRRSLPHRQYRGLMQSLGYDWHPALPDGRCTATCEGAYGGRIKLYIKKGHKVLNESDPVAIAAEYNAAQAAAVLGA